MPRFAEIITEKGEKEPGYFIKREEDLGSINIIKYKWYDTIDHVPDNYLTLVTKATTKPRTRVIISDEKFRKKV